MISSLFRSTAAPSYTPTAQSGYAYGTAATQRATGYDQSGYQAQSYASKNIYNVSYQASPYNVNSNPILATPQTYEYGYGRPAQTYDAKTYYQQAGASYVPTTYDQTAATANKAATSYAQPARTTIQQKPTQYSQSAYATAPTTANTANKQQNAANAAASYSSYDSALYSAATGIYMAQQQTQNKVVNQGGQNQQQQQGGWGNQKRNNAFKPRKNPVPKPQQIHYCDVCKISCAGPQTYREHLEGQKHKKREALQKAQAEAAQSATAQNTTQQAAPVVAQSRGSNLRCELCDVTCTGNDAYSAHVRGSKHQKVVKLHTKLGKPIPSSEPTPLGAAKEGKDGEDQETPAEDVKPVGEEYIEEMKDADGKIVTFNCKLCDCKFNDPNAKEMHTKGRRHRLQYKKKVQPDLVVDVKPTLRQRKLAEREKQRQAMQEELWNRRRGINEGEMDDDERMYWDERRRYEEEMNGPPGGNWNNPNFPMRGRPLMGGYPPMFNMMNNRRIETLDDRHVIARHAEIYPKEEELQGIQKIVSHTERALKLVSDAMTTEIKKDEKMEEAPTEVKEEPKNTENKENGNQNNMISFQKDTEGTVRLLKGVMRVGLLAKGKFLFFQYFIFN